MIRRWSKRMLAALLGLTLTLGLAELVVRFLPVGAPPVVLASTSIHDGQDLLTAHKGLGWALAPGLDRKLAPTADYEFFSVTTEPFADGSFGFRGPHPPELFGALLGDSFAFGFGVDDEDTIPSLLTAQGKGPWGNFGVFGYGPQQAGFIAREYALARKPKVAVWMFFENDLVDGHRLTFPDALSHGPQKSSFGRHLRNTYWAAYKFYRYKSSYLSSNREHYRSGEVEAVLTYSVFHDLNLERPGLQTGLKVLREELASFQELCLAQDTLPVLVLVPHKECVYSEEFRSVARREAEWDRLTGVRREVSDYAESIDLDTLDLTPTLQAARDRQIYLVVDPHLSSAGNAVAAEAIGDFVSGL